MTKDNIGSEETLTLEANNDSCDRSFTRVEFIRRVVKGAALTGGVLASPKIIDKFLVPPAYAATSTCSLNVGDPTTSGNAKADCTVSSNQITCGACGGGTDADPIDSSSCSGGSDLSGGGFTCP
jgi:hypothetical protein